MKTDWSLTAECLEKFLSWLSADREEAWTKFEKLRKQLTARFVRRGCHIPEELFDQTVDVACRKIEWGEVDQSVDPGAYCYGVATNVIHEYWRRLQPVPLPDDLPDWKNAPAWDERELKCLDLCLDQLSPHDRDVVIRYHQDRGREKIEVHKVMAAQQGGLNALRVRVCRIKRSLRDCVSDCMKHEGALQQ